MTHSKRSRIPAIGLAALLALLGIHSAFGQETMKESQTESLEKPRLLLSQDGEIDDMNSLIHLLLYANEIDIVGIVQSSSKLHYRGTEELEPLRWCGTDWMYSYLDAYEEVYPNLSAQDPDYPEPDQLRRITKVGNVDNVDEMQEDTEGSDLIRALLLDEDPRILYVAVGGGFNTFARALASIEEDYQGTDAWEEIYDRICKKVIVNCWGKQDASYTDYIQDAWEDIKVIDVAAASLSYGYSYGKTDLPEPARKKMEGSWMLEKLLQGHGALMDLYAVWGDGKYYEGEDPDQQFGSNEDMLSSTNWWGGKMGLIYNRYDFLSEGDSLDWMRLIPTGLRSLEDASYGGWGGRYEFKGVKDHENISWYASADSNSLSPWIEAIQDDFAARASWCTARTYEEANHAPSLSIEEGTDLTAKAGEEILLHPLAEDPDGDAVTLLAYQYAPADSYPDQIDENGDETATIAPKLEGDVISFKIPEDAKAGETIHLIVEAVDQASLPMHHYARVIISIS